MTRTLNELMYELGIHADYGDANGRPSSRDLAREAVFELRRLRRVEEALNTIAQNPNPACSHADYAHEALETRSSEGTHDG